METSIKSQNKKIYSAYDVHISCNLVCPPGDDKTKQSFGDECNINIIMARYEKTGIAPIGNSLPPQYGEAAAFDFQEAQNIIITAERMFDALPAGIRSKFDNNPHTMLGWMENPENETEAIKLGLIRAAEGAEGAKAPLVPEVATTPPSLKESPAGVPTPP